ncbi:NACHT, LRR and PYD domains-containing protein 3-like [Sphaerodactylus townsendi]|uniref:Uncharacterized protein n=1 Tax=Sphaerodactylus townsendi TaxID=933632 RepID=A0ACB8ERX7_9SAUR|nr:NACHT, LRR and PYD domains-containing protein 3-like [Sphaerodactylus townsendi]
MEEALQPVEEALLFALDDLRGENFKRFKNKLCFLKMDGKAPIPWSQLRDADTVDTVQLLLQAYGEEGARDMAIEVLKTINLQGSASRLQKSKRNDCRKKYKQHIQESFGSRWDQPIHRGIMVSLRQSYTELLLTRTPCPQGTAHEQKHQEMEAHPKDFLEVSLESLFVSDAQSQSSRTVVLLGPAGVGKTTVMWKIMLDWAFDKLWQERFDYVFYIPCGAIDCTGQPMSVVDLILGSCPPGILTEDVFMNQESLLVILDGFDGLKHPSLPSETLSSDLHKKQAPKDLLLGLLGKKLLAKSHLLVTSRPTALRSLQLSLKQPQFVEVLGFCPSKRKEYFHHHFRNQEEATGAFEIMQRNETLFSMCCLPVVCWIICSIFRKKLQSGLFNVIPETATLTEIHMLLLFNCLEGCFRPSNLEALCSLAKDGILHKMMVFDEETLKAHGLSHPEWEALSASGRVLHQAVFGTAMYKFTHLGFHEFFAALFFLLEKDEDPASPLTDLNKVLGHRKQQQHSDYFMLLRFLFGLSNTKRLSALQKTWSCQADRKGLLPELLRWVEEEAKHHYFKRPQNLMELCHCVYETEDTEFAKRVMGHIHSLDLRDQLSTKLDFEALCFCLTASDVPHSLWLSGYLLGPAGLEHLLPGLLTSSDIHLNRCGLSTAACETLASVMETNQGLTTLDLGDNPLGDSGVICLCDRLMHSCSQLQSLRMNCCNLTAAACESLSRFLVFNQCLTELELVGNHLEDLGVWQLCEGLKCPQSRLQRLLLHSCGLTDAVCEGLASVVGTSESLTDLGLGENQLGDEGVRQLSAALKKPSCRLKRLELTMKFLNQTTKKKLQAACATHPELLLVSYYPPGFPVFPGEDS